MIAKNIVANLVARAWGFLSVYLLLPLYLEFLGKEAFGLVGFYSTLLGVIAFVDMGFTATLNREMARLSVRDDGGVAMKDTLRTYEVWYLCVSAAVAIALWLVAPLIAERWLRSEALGTAEVTTAVRLMGLAITIQLVGGLYVGGLMGLERQVRANTLQIAWGALRGVGAVLLLWLVSPTIWAFAAWQVFSNGAYCLATRGSLWRAISSGSALSQSQPHFRWGVLRDTWRYAAGLAGMAVLSTVVVQADKVAVSKMLTLELLGYYTLAVAVASVPVTLAGPIGSAVFPRLTGLVEVGDLAGLARLYHRACDLVAFAAIPGGVTLAVFAGDFIRAWTGSGEAAREGGLVAGLLAAGQVMQAVTLVPYYLVLAHGSVRVNLGVGIASAVMIIPLLILLVGRWGLVGGGMSWLLMNACTLPFYMYFVHRRFLPGELRRWCFQGVGRPLVVSAACVALARWLVPHVSSRLLSACVIGLVWCGAAAASVLVCSTVRRELAQRWHGWMGRVPAA